MFIPLLLAMKTKKLNYTLLEVYLTLRPYYQDSNATLYLGDCVEVAATLPKASVDLIVTDPPYGVTWQSGHRTTAFNKIVGDESTDVALRGLTAALPVLRRRRHIYVFGRYDLTTLPLTTPVELIWDKGIGSLGNLSIPWSQEHEYIQFAIYGYTKTERAEGAGRLAARLRRGTILSYQRLNSVQVVNHPTEKPVALLRELIESSSCIGETVLDPFAGSGSTLVAATLEGRKSIGVEIEERYCEVAAKRLEALSRLSNAA
jgi:DNA modification methylase